MENIRRRSMMLMEKHSWLALRIIASVARRRVSNGDAARLGRKSTLIATLLLMGLATFAVALVPTYERIGIWGAVLLTILRFIQGVGVGGEWGGSVLMSMEWARCNHSRGF